MKQAELGQVVILAGGRGTRLRSLGGDVPKVLRPVAGRPFVELLLEPFREQGFRRFHFCLGHGGGEVADCLSRIGGDLELTVAVEGRPLGTAGALASCRVQLDEAFLCVMGDTYFEFDYRSLTASLPASAEGMLVVSSAGSGVVPNVELGQAGAVTGYDKAGIVAGWTDTGVALLRRRCLDLLAGTEPPIDLGALYRRLIERRALRARTTDRGFADIGTPARYRGLDRALRAGAAPEGAS